VVEQGYAGYSIGFERTFLFKVFNSIMEIFPNLNLGFDEWTLVNYIKDLTTLELNEQLALFKHLIGKNPEGTIRFELEKLIIEINNLLITESWDHLLPKVNDWVDLAQLLDDREFLVETFLTIVLIKNSDFRTGN
jgi:hypothetical protein